MSIRSSCVEALRGWSWRTEHLHPDTSQFPCGSPSRKIMENWTPASGYIAVPVRTPFTEVLSCLFACRHIPVWRNPRKESAWESMCVEIVNIFDSLLTLFLRRRCYSRFVYLRVSLLSWIYMFCTMIQTDASYLFRTAYIHKNQYSAVGFYIRYIKS